MLMAVDLRKVRYLINALGLTPEEALHIDVRLASEYGLLLQLSAGQSALLNSKRIELAWRNVEGDMS
jgi:hypothetical protein